MIPARLTAVIALLLALSATAGQAPAARQPSPAAVAARVIDLVNQARSQGRRCGRESFPSTAPLIAAPPLQAAAEAHARDMAAREYFAHRGADGSEPRDRIRGAGYESRLSGENIAFAPESAEEVVAGWLASPGHCANIMDARFRHTGVGLATGRTNGQIYWVQTFGAPRAGG
jgi:uncharacterized protein YkwD